jgi:hypothetical protein
MFGFLHTKRQHMGTADMTPIQKRPFATQYTAGRHPDEWNWPFPPAQNIFGTRYQNYWWGNQLPNQAIFVNTMAGTGNNVGNHHLWVQAPQTTIPQLNSPSLGMSFTPPMSGLGTASLLGKMSASFNKFYGGPS